MPDMLAQMRRRAPVALGRALVCLSTMLVALGAGSVYAQQPQARRVAVTNSDLAYSAATGKFYAAVPASAVTNANSIATIDPLSGTVASYLPIGADPSRLAISDDGWTLWVGLKGTRSMRRIDLHSGQPVGSEFVVGSAYGAYAWDIAVQPGNPNVVAVLRWDNHSVVVFDNGQQRTGVVAPAGSPCIDTITFAAPDVLLGVCTSNFREFSRMRVDANGAALDTFVQGIAPRGSITFAKGLLWGSDGTIATAAPLRRQAVMPVPSSTYAGTPDPGGEVAFFVTSPSYLSAGIAAFDTRTYRQLWSLDLPNTFSQSESTYVSRATRWGESGLAFRSDSAVYFVDLPSAPALRHTLSVNAVGTGTGTISSAPAGITCGTACSAAFAAGTVVELAATAATGSSFEGWTGPAAECAGAQTPIQVTINAATSCTARFTSTASAAPSLLRLGLRTRDLIYDSSRNRIYATVDATHSSLGNSVVAIDPSNGQVVSALWVGSNPSKLALADDGVTMYAGIDSAGAFQRIDLRTFSAVGAPVLIPTDSDSGQPGVLAMKVQPGNADVVVIEGCTTDGSSPNYARLMAFDHGVLRPTTLARTVSPDSFVFGAASDTIWGRGRWGDNDVLKISLTSEGLATTDAIANALPSAGPIEFAERHLYGTLGRVFNTDTEKQEGNFALNAYRATMALDLTNGVVWFLKEKTADTVQSLVAFDRQTFLQRGSVDVPVAGSSYYDSPTNLLRTGETFAFRNSHSVYLVALPAGGLRARYTLQLNGAGTGTGTVTSSPAAITCGGTCSATFDQGTVVRLTATADPGSTFGGWSGAPDCADGEVTIAAAITCTATFNSATAGSPAIARIGVPTRDAVYDASRNRLYVSVPAEHSVYGNSIVSIDVTSGEIVSAVWVGSNPTKLALADDGFTLYVALEGSSRVRRVDLRTFTAGAEFDVPLLGYYGVLNIFDMKVQPGNPDTVVLVGGDNGLSPPNGPMMAFRNGALLPNTLSASAAPLFIDFGGSPATIWGSAIWGGNNLAGIALNDQGLTVTNTIAGVFPFAAPLRFDQGRLYSASGRVVNPETGGLYGTFTDAATYFRPAMGIDAAHGVAYFLKETSFSGYSLSAYDTATFERLWTLGRSFPERQSGSERPVVTPVGAGKIAVVTYDSVFFVDLQSAPPVQHTLAVNSSGNGSGTIYSTPSGISCGYTCSAAFAANAVVRLTATPASGSLFQGWSGPTDCADGQVTVTAATACTAIFVSQTPGKPPMLRIGLITGDLVYDRTRNVLYASVASSHSVYGNSVVRIDPSTGQILSSLWVGSEPSKLGLSDDARVLYVGLDGASAVARVDLDTFTVNQQFRLPADALSGPLPIGAIQVQPGNAEVVVVVTRRAGSSPDNGPVFVFDHGVQRPQTIASNQAPKYIAFGSSSAVLFGTAASYNGDLTQMTIGADGIATSNTLRNAFTQGQPIRFDDGRLYAGHGQVINPETGTPYGTFFNTGYAGALTTDVARGVALFLVYNFSSSTSTLMAYHPTTFQLLWSLALPIVTQSNYDVPTWRLELIGGRTLAFRSRENVYIVDLDAASAPTLTLKAGGTGLGSVGSSSGLSCGTECSGGVPYGTVVTLFATPQAGSLFRGWSGDADCSDGTVTMTQARLCTALFYRKNDFDLDGKADLVWRNRVTGGLVFHLMDGSTKTNAGAGDRAWKVTAIADFNGDANPDLVMRNNVTGANEIWYMAGTDKWSSASLPQVADQRWQIMGAADFNADRYTDLVWRNGQNGDVVVWYMKNTAYLGFATVASIKDPAWVVGGVEDFNADGKPDIVWRNTTTGQNLVWFLDGPNYMDWAPLRAESDTNWAIMALEDMNGDGRPDIVWHNRATGQTRIDYMNGTTWTGSNWLYERTDAELEPVSGTTVAPRPATVGDFNLDGTPDVLWHNEATGANNIWYMSGADGSTKLGEGSVQAAPTLAWKSVAVADFNGDGLQDIVWRNASTGENLIWLMKGRTKTGEMSLPTIPDADWNIVGVGDFNQDGHPDLAWRNFANGQNVIWFLRDGQYLDYSAPPTITDTNWKIVAVGDFNGDGWPDLFWRNVTTGVDIAWFLVNGEYAGWGQPPTIPDPLWTIVGAGDFNGDGKADLIWRNAAKPSPGDPQDPSGKNLLWYLRDGAYIGYAWLPTLGIEWKTGAGQ